MPQDEVLQNAYDQLLITAIVLADIEDDREALSLLEACGRVAVLLGGTSRGCDGCELEMDPEVFDVTGRFSWAVQRDSNGDPDVSICPRCRLEAQEPPL